MRRKRENNNTREEKERHLQGGIWGTCTGYIMYKRGIEREEGEEDVEY